MKTIARQTKIEPTIAAPAAVVLTPSTLPERAAAEAMWVYYRDHKPLLITDIRDYRAGILTQLMAGLAVEDVFAPYFKPAEPAKALRRAA